MRLTPEEIESCKRTGEMKALTMMYMETTKLRLQQGVYWDSAIQADYECLKVLREKKDTKYFVFITISPPNDTTLKDLVKCGKKLMSKKWLLGRFLLVYEQRGETEADMGHHCHIHMICITHELRETSGKAMSLQHCKDGIQRTAESMLTGLQLTGGWWSPRPKEEMKKSVGYMLEDKKDKKKHLAQKFDKIWRKANGLKEYYGTTEFSGTPHDTCTHNE